MCNNDKITIRRNRGCINIGIIDIYEKIVGLLK